MEQLTAMGSPAWAVRARRLDRLRQSRAAPPHRPDTSSAPASLRPAHGRARRTADLAEALGGGILAGSDGQVVVLEASGQMALSRQALAGLPDPVDPTKPLVCLDTETTGLGTGAGTVPFLVGFGTWLGDRFTVRQLLLPDHASEPAFLAAVAEAIPDDAWLVTYNGRSFDWPLVVARFRLHRRGPPTHAGHLDLLPVARRLWRHRLPDARLASVESGVAGVRRESDLPGALIPERYFAFLRHGRAEVLRDVVRHNRQDVASLARLLLVLARCINPAAWVSEVHPGDLHGLGRAYLRRRRYQEALSCFGAARPRASMTSSPGPWAIPLSDRLAADQARLLGRMGRHEHAAHAWLELAEAEGPLAPVGWIQVAKHREHRVRDPTGALAAARRAATLIARPLPVRARLSWAERDLSVRVARLSASVARAQRACS